MAKSVQFLLDLPPAISDNQIGTFAVMAVSNDPEILKRVMTDQPLWSSDLRLVRDPVTRWWPSGRPHLRMGRDGFMSQAPRALNPDALVKQFRDAFPEIANAHAEIERGLLANAQAEILTVGNKSEPSEEPLCSCGYTYDNCDYVHGAERYCRKADEIGFGELGCPPEPEDPPAPAAKHDPFPQRALLDHGRGYGSQW